MILSLFLVVTLVTILLQAVQRSHRSMSLIGVVHPLVTFILTLYLISIPDQWEESAPYFLVDHLNLLLMVITGIVFTCASMYAVGYMDGLIRSGALNPRSLRIFYIGYSLLLLSVTMAFFASNAATFWIFAELTTVFSALLIAILAVRETIDASLKYIFVCSTSMLFSFIGVLFLFELMRQVTGTGTVDWQILLSEAPHCDSGMLMIAAIFFGVGCAAKSGIVPLHTWLPEAHARAPSAVSAVLSGCVLNVGMYGILRMTGIVHQTTITGQISILLICGGILTMGVACFSLLSQKGIKELIAFSSIENMGFLLLATGIGTPIAIFWMLFHMIGHSMIKTGLFFSAGILHHQYHGHSHIRHLFRLQPFAAVACILGSVAIIGTPLFPLFLSKIGILIEVGRVNVWLTGIVLLLFSIAASALFRFILRMMHDDGDRETLPVQYLAPLWMKIPIIALLLLAGIAGVLILPGEEAFILAAVQDLGIGGPEV